jgi:tRNA dimethylallyltransferase
MTLEELYAYCKNNNVPLPENFKNKRYVIRAIESKGQVPQKRSEPLKHCVVVGIATDKVVLRQRIEVRAEQLFEDDVAGEAKMLGKKYGWNSEAMKSNIYPLLHAYLDGDMTLNDVKIKFSTLDWRLAKRQMTWLRRNSFIHWASLKEAKKYLADQLAIYG